jgi:hypothetical protein
MQKQVLHNQSLLDFSLHHCGQLDSLVALAISNDISITVELVPGTLLRLQDTVDKADDIVDFYNFKNIKPACGFVGNTLPDVPTGIDYMIIGTDFIIA